MFTRRIWAGMTWGRSLGGWTSMGAPSEREKCSVHMMLTPLTVQVRTVLRQNGSAFELSASEQFDTKTIIGKENGFVKTQNHDRSVVFRCILRRFGGGRSARQAGIRPAGRRPASGISKSGSSIWNSRSGRLVTMVTGSMSRMLCRSNTPSTGPGGHLDAGGPALSAPGPGRGNRCCTGS